MKRYMLRRLLLTALVGAGALSTFLATGSEAKECSGSDSFCGVDDNATEERKMSDSVYDPKAFEKPSDEELKASLSEKSYKVTQEDGTERPFSNELFDEKRAGLYVDIVSGEPLFSSSDKYDSGTGWPSFIRPIAEGVVTEHVDRGIFSTRTEIRSSVADSHLGHVFSDGPAPTGQRYCMNSAAMEFIPLDQMKERGYGDLISRVQEQ